MTLYQKTLLPTPGRHHEHLEKLDPSRCPRRKQQPHWIKTVESPPRDLHEPPPTSCKIVCFRDQRSTLSSGLTRVPIFGKEGSKVVRATCCTFPSSIPHHALIVGKSNQSYVESRQGLPYTNYGKENCVNA